MSADVTDRELVERTKAGHRAAFAELYVRYRGAIHAIALARLPPQEAGDLVQEVFLQAMKRLGNKRGEVWVVAERRQVDIHAQAFFIHALHPQMNENRPRGCPVCRTPPA